MLKMICLTLTIEMMFIKHNLTLDNSALFRLLFTGGVTFDFLIAISSNHIMGVVQLK